MTPRGVRDARAVDVLNDQLIICDGYDSYSSTSPDRYAIKFFNVVDLDGTQPPPRRFTATPADGAGAARGPVHRQLHQQPDELAVELR